MFSKFRFWFLLILLASCSPDKDVIVFVHDLEEFFIISESQARKLSGSIVSCDGVKIKIPDNSRYFYGDIEEDIVLKESAVVHDCR